MSENILVTGGAGFIGSHIVDGLLQKGHRVRVLDNLDPQVHGKLNEIRKPPDYLSTEAEFIFGDIRDINIVETALKNIDVVFHEAAAVGVGQSMYNIQHYTSVNSLGAAVLLEAIVNSKNRPRKIIVASSMSIYGEGAYFCPIHGEVFPKLRDQDQLKNHDWELYCTVTTCKEHIKPIPTGEHKPLYPTSIYAINKRDHEEMFMSVGKAYNIPAIALRYFNTYGTRQSLSNPYTGVAAIFCSRLLNNKAPVIFENGNQLRDYIHVSDIVQANLLALEYSAADNDVFNVGTGIARSVLDVANTLTFLLKADQSVFPSVTNQFRVGDIRHCFADITNIQNKVNFIPKMTLKEGFGELVEWVGYQNSKDAFEQAQEELKARGLTI